MSPATPIPVALPPPAVDQEEFHRRLYQFIRVVTHKSLRKKRRKLDEADAKILYEALVEAVMRYAIASGAYRFPGGWGSLVLKPLKPATRKMPSGRVITLDQPRVVLRYKEGLATRDAMGKVERYPARKNPRTSALKELGFETV